MNKDLKYSFMHWCHKSILFNIAFRLHLFHWIHMTLMAFIQSLVIYSVHVCLSIFYGYVWCGLTTCNYRVDWNATFIRNKECIILGWKNQNCVSIMCFVTMNRNYSSINLIKSYFESRIIKPYWLELSPTFFQVMTSVGTLIYQHQRLPGNILCALVDRLG